MSGQKKNTLISFNEGGGEEGCAGQSLAVPGGRSFPGFPPRFCAPHGCTSSMKSPVSGRRNQRCRLLVLEEAVAGVLSTPPRSVAAGLQVLHQRRPVVREASCTLKEDKKKKKVQK